MSSGNATVVSDTQIDATIDLGAILYNGAWIIISDGDDEYMISLPEIEPVPAITVTCPLGIAFGGSNNCSVDIGSLDAVDLILTSSGSGAAQFQNGLTQMTVYVSQSVTIFGVSASTRANDIALSGSGVTGRAAFSVVSVSIGLNAGTPYADDSSYSYFEQGIVTGSGGPLGAAIFSTIQGIHCGNGVELVGWVSPGNYGGTVTLKRDIVSGGIWQGQTYAGSIAPGPDNSDAMYEVMTSTSQGHVFDLDAPGIVPANAINHVRQNYSEYAVLDSGPEIGGSRFPWYSRISCGYTSGNASVSYAIRGDNQAGSGATPLTLTFQ
jgi:hypothetical protein